MKSSLSYSLVSLSTLVTSSAAAATLFDFENAQLETSHLAHLNDSTKALFTFGNAYTADAPAIAAKRSACKVFPGDAAWPSDRVWDIFNELLGGALIKTKPIASSCYNDWDYVSLAP